MYSAYEISTHWKREPPPKEILEDVTAKGGGLLTRTMENFARPISRETESLANGHDTASPEPAKTPKEEKMDVDESGSASGRTTRGELILVSCLSSICSTFPIVSRAR